MLHDFLIAPFVEFQFMRKALIAALILSISAPALGAMVVVRRLSLVGDTIAHAILPGVAAAYLFFGKSMLALSLGGLAAGLLAVLFSGMIVKGTKLKEDASFASIYLLSLAGGTSLIALKGSNQDLLDLLFGNILAIPESYFYFQIFTAITTWLIFFGFYRLFVAEAFDANMLRIGGGNWYYFAFLALVVLNIVCALQVFGALLAIGLFVLPAIVCRLWCRTLPQLMLASAVIGAVCGYIGLLASYHYNVPSGASIILSLGFFYILSLALDFLRRQWQNNGRMIIAPSPKS